MIEVFKLTHNIYDPDVSLKLEYNLGCSTRGNKYKLLNCTFCHDLRKYYFSARNINIWNSLPNCVVDVSTGPILSVFPALIVHSELKSVHPGFPVAFIFKHKLVNK